MANLDIATNNNESRPLTGDHITLLIEPQNRSYYGWCWHRRGVVKCDRSSKRNALPNCHD